MTNASVHMLACYYNMTIHTFNVENVRRDYMLEVNPKYTDPSYDDTLNVIDARWIDIETGLFIDITAVRPHMTKNGVMCSKDQHEEYVSSFHSFPLDPQHGPPSAPTQIAEKNPPFRSMISSHCATPSSKTSRSRSPTITTACSRRNTATRPSQRPRTRTTTSTRRVWSGSA